jgi:branched-chain amino acid transport system permease protein
MTAWAKRHASVLVGLAVVIVLALLPYSALAIPGVLPGPLNSPGTLQVLAICLVFAAVALTYDLLFGFTGLLSFGHALYFAVGVYVTAIALTHWHWGLVPSVLAALLAGLVVALVTGAVALRVQGIAFAMVTLAFAQAGSVLVVQDPLDRTGGEQGLGLDVSKVPDAFIGVLNTQNLYWLALVLAVVVYVVVRVVTRSPAGHVWAAIRENELRATVLGLRTYAFKLVAFVIASVLATLCGAVYVLIVGGASSRVTTADFTLTLLVMVVLGGSGVRWGAMLGGFAYMLLDQRLGSLAGVDAISALPAVLEVPLSQPLFLLGTLFVIVVMFLPGGLASLTGLRRTRRPLETPNGPTGGSTAGSTGTTPDARPDAQARAEAV